VLLKIGIIDYDEYLSIYEDRMTETSLDSVLLQTYIDNDVFLGQDCYTVLNSILISFNAIIRQNLGHMVIYRPTELIKDSIWGRVMGTTVTPKQLLPNKVIDRTGGDLVDFEGGVLMYKTPLNTFTSTQDYGNRESWIKNHTFDITTWQGYLAGSARFTSWSNGSSPVAPLSHYNKTSQELQGILFSGGGAAGQVFGTYAKLCTDELIISFDYLLINLNASPVATCDVSLQLYDNTYAYWLTNDTDERAVWTGTGYSSLVVTETAVPVGVGEWKTATFGFTGLPIDGPYTILLLPPAVANLNTAFKNIRFYTTSDDKTVKIQKKSRWKNWVNMIPPFGLIRFFGGGYKKVDVIEINDLEEVIERNYTATNTINGEDGSQKLILGDVSDTDVVNILEQYAGALAIDSTGLIPTATWHTLGNVETLPLLQITTNEIGALYSKGRHFLQLNLYELTEDLNIIGNLQDPLNVVGASRRVFVFSRGTLNCQAREWTADFIEIGTK
jgi:hypothetical protein